MDLKKIGLLSQVNIQREEESYYLESINNDSKQGVYAYVYDDGDIKYFAYCDGVKVEIDIQDLMLIKTVIEITTKESK